MHLALIGRARSVSSSRRRPGSIRGMGTGPLFPARGSLRRCDKIFAAIWRNWSTVA